MNRMIEKETEPSPEFEHSRHLGNGIVDVVDVFEHQARDCRVEGLVGEGQCGRTGSGERWATSSLGGYPHAVPRRVDAGHDTPLCRRETRDLAIATADVEHMPSILELRFCHRQDLLFVLGIGPVGESVDPPVGMILPEVLGLLVHPRRLRTSHLR
jgi:hypothetical protein